MDKAEISRERLEAVLGELLDRKSRETERADAAAAKIGELRDLVAELRCEVAEGRRALSSSELRVERLEQSEVRLERELLETRDEAAELRAAFDRADGQAELLVDLVLTATMAKRPREVDAAMARLEVAEALRAHTRSVQS